MTFRLKSEDETRSAVLMTLALGTDDNYQKWDKIHQPTCFCREERRSVLFRVSELLQEIYGAGVALGELASGDKRWETFMQAAGELEPPAINSVPIFDADLQPDREQEIKGFRFMGQRFTPDASIFQRLIYREVEENSQGERRMLPRALDIPAAMGSEEAYAILEAAEHAADNKAQKHPVWQKPG